MAAGCRHRGPPRRARYSTPPSSADAVGIAAVHVVRNAGITGGPTASVSNRGGPPGPWAYSISVMAHRAVRLSASNSPAWRCLPPARAPAASGAVALRIVALRGGRSPPRGRVRAKIASSRSASASAISARRQLAGGYRGPHRRPAAGTRRRGRRKPSRDPHRLRAADNPHGALQMGQQDARQHQERDHPTYRKLGPDHNATSPASPGDTTGATSATP